MTWEVGIEGEQLDIREIEKLAAAFDCQVSESQARFFLSQLSLRSLVMRETCAVAQKKS